MSQPRLYSYVVDHDEGFAPNPVGGLCTLAYCKFSHSGRRNLVEMASEGDWVAGTGGKGSKTAGHGRLIYAMRVTEKIALARYAAERRFAGRIDRDPLDPNMEGRFVLISDDFFYFGRNAINIDRIPRHHLSHRFEKRGPNYRSDYTREFVADFDAWIHGESTVGVHGEPCAPHPQYSEATRRSGCVRRYRRPRCPPRRTRKPTGPC
jgi:hypothetical protein